MIFIRVLCVRDDVTGVPVGLDVRNGEEFTHGLDVAGGNTCSRAKNHFTSGGDFTTYCWKKDKHVYASNASIFLNHDSWWISNREHQVPINYTYIESIYSFKTKNHHSFDLLIDWFIDCLIDWLMLTLLSNNIYLYISNIRPTGQVNDFVWPSRSMLTILLKPYLVQLLFTRLVYF